MLAKGIHSSDDSVKQAIEAGADLVLVVGRIPKIYAEKCLIEPYSFKELSKLPSNVKAVWNSRNLSDGGFKQESFDEARKAFKGWLCQASNIRTKKDVNC